MTNPVKLEAMVCQYLGCEAEQIKGLRETADAVVVVVDYGIKGGKKYTIPLTDLPEPQIVEFEPAAAKSPVKKSVQPKKPATRKRSASK